MTSLGSDGNELGSMGSALLLHQRAMKILAQRGQDVGGPSHLMKVELPFLVVYGSKTRLEVHLTIGSVEPMPIYRWEDTGVNVNVNYAPIGLRRVLKLLEAEMVLDDLAEIPSD